MGDTDTDTGKVFGEVKVRGQRGVPFDDAHHGVEGGGAADSQRFAVDGRVVGAGDAQFQETLARAHEAPARPRCLCVPGGAEMYVARHRHFVIKRMPGTGQRHAPCCPSFEPDPSQSGLGELAGEAVIETEPGRVELRVDFPWVRMAGRSKAAGLRHEVAEVSATHRRMSLRALMHFLFERAGFNRWTPAMEGKRNQGVLHKYLTEAAEGISIKGLSLGERLYVPEPFSEATHQDAARRRREHLTVVTPSGEGSPLAVVIGEFKTAEATSSGRRVWIRHMPDAPLLVDDPTWQRIERRFAASFEARDADIGQSVRLMMAMLIRARREHTYEIDTASVMLTSEHWIPIEGVHELPLVCALVEARRRFVKPLRYDAASAAGFANALLLDAGPTPVPLHVISSFMTAVDRRIKERAVAREGSAWVWRTEQAMQPLCPIVRQSIVRRI